MQHGRPARDTQAPPAEEIARENRGPDLPQRMSRFLSPTAPTSGETPWRTTRKSLVDKLQGHFLRWPEIEHRPEE